MEIRQLPVAQAVGHILVHHQTGPDGRKVLKKGRVLTGDDVAVLQSLGREAVVVAVLAEDDLPENEAARRLAGVVAGPHLVASKPVGGRVNFFADTPGLLKVNIDGLLAFNDHDGITLATRLHNTVLTPKMQAATLKIIPYAIPRSAVEAAAGTARQFAPLVTVRPFTRRRVVLLTTGSEQARESVVNGFTPALSARMARYGAALVQGPHTTEDVSAIADAIHQAAAQAAEMVIIAGETSIMDRDDIVPQAIRAAGGVVEHFGVPAEPGNLLLLAYLGDLPIVGAPGCARSKKFNVVDRVLPRLVAGERLTRRDLLALGHGGLLRGEDGLEG
ncbi:MAG: molybdopterin-binding protein [Chloroflexi bacterium]|nr:MAG: molybdopterin-binding protein [Chloroflexota bacterium]